MYLRYSITQVFNVNHDIMQHFQQTKSAVTSVTSVSAFLRLRSQQSRQSSSPCPCVRVIGNYALNISVFILGDIIIMCYLFVAYNINCTCFIYRQLQFLLVLFYDANHFFFLFLALCLVLYTMLFCQNMKKNKLPDQERHCL
jgi:hypothetical protein